MARSLKNIEKFIGDGFVLRKLKKLRKTVHWQSKEELDYNTWKEVQKMRLLDEKLKRTIEGKELYIASKVVNILKLGK